MSKAWDILPPRPKIRRTVYKQKRRQNKNLPFLFFLIILGAIVIIFFGSEKPEAQSNNPLSSTISASPVSSGPKIKILNGSGDNEQLSTVKKNLERANFQIQTTENAVNLYEETIIYYNEEYQAEAQKIAEILSNYQAKIQKFTKITNYDLLIVIGQ